MVIPNTAINRTNGVTLSCCCYGDAKGPSRVEKRAVYSSWWSYEWQSVHSSLVNRREKERAVRVDETGFTRTQGDTIVYPLYALTRKSLFRVHNLIKVHTYISVWRVNDTI